MTARTLDLLRADPVWASVLAKCLAANAQTARVRRHTVKKIREAKLGRERAARERFYRALTPTERTWFGA